ncbi:MAG: nitroreductase family protein [Acidobacteria bacterium]|nr:nitroreductase family protein [Acidobacteriota bacterium]
MTPPRFIPYEFNALSDEERLQRAEAFYREMSRRRSVRYFSDQPLPACLLEKLIATAGTAPSGANQQPWTFVVVTDASLKKEIREAAEAEEREFYEHRATSEWLSDLEPLGTNWVKDFLEIAPALVVVFRQTHGARPDGSVKKYYYTQESVGIATGLLIAAIHRAGLVTLTHTPSPMNFLEKILRRPPNEKAFVLMPIGLPAAGATVPDIARKPLEQILVHDRSAP